MSKNEHVDAWTQVVAAFANKRFHLANFGNGKSKID